MNNGWLCNEAIIKWCLEIHTCTRSHKYTHLVTYVTTETQQAQYSPQRFDCWGQETRAWTLFSLATWQQNKVLNNQWPTSQRLNELMWVYMWASSAFIKQNCSIKTIWWTYWIGDVLELHKQTYWSCTDSGSITQFNRDRCRSITQFN